MHSIEKKNGTRMRKNQFLGRSKDIGAVYVGWIEKNE